MTNMNTKLKTVFDDFNECDNHELLKHIAKMLALKDPEYQDAFLAMNLQDQIRLKMYDFEKKNRGRNYEVIVRIDNVNESSTFRARKLGSAMDPEPEMGAFEYLEQVIDPVSKELAARVVSKLPRPFLTTDCDITVCHLG